MNCQHILDSVCNVVFITLSCTISFPGSSTGQLGREPKLGPQHGPQQGTGRPQASVHPNPRHGNPDHENHHDDHPLMKHEMNREVSAGSVYFSSVRQC